MSVEIGQLALDAREESNAVFNILVSPRLTNDVVSVEINLMPPKTVSCQEVTKTQTRKQIWMPMGNEETKVGRKSMQHPMEAKEKRKEKEKAKAKEKIKAKERAKAKVREAKGTLTQLQL